MSIKLRDPPLFLAKVSGVTVGCFKGDTFAKLAWEGFKADFKVEVDEDGLTPPSLLGFARNACGWFSPDSSSFCPLVSGGFNAPLLIW